MMFPLIPEEILVRILPSRDGRDQRREGDLPWESPPTEEIEKGISGDHSPLLRKG